MTSGKTPPGLFGQRHSNRNYTDPDCWGKNQFNSSFPASLVAYMSSRGLKPVYLRIDSGGNLVHDYITGAEIFGIDPLSENAFYNFEAGYCPFETYYQGKREKIDLVMMDNATKRPLRGLEVKLTALPDSTTKSRPEDGYSCEIVVRPSTVCFIACSICDNYTSHDDMARLRSMLFGIQQINHWEEADEVASRYESIKEAVLTIANDMYGQQKPLLLQPVWKVERDSARLAEDCLDVFVWSNLATIQMCLGENEHTRGFSRFHRTIIWLYKMLLDYAVHGSFDYVRIVKNQAYGVYTDKAFALSGNGSHPLLRCDELTHPRIGRDEIRNIILGGGQNLLKPERRFDAVLVNSPYLFD